MGKQCRTQLAVLEREFQEAATTVSGEFKNHKINGLWEPLLAKEFNQRSVHVSSPLKFPNDQNTQTAFAKLLKKAAGNLLYLSTMQIPENFLKADLKINL